MVIGVSGGIASGKSTVVSFFKEWGADIIDVDKLGWEVLESKQKEVIKVFGKEVLVKKVSPRVILGRLLTGKSLANSFLQTFTRKVN